MPRLVVRSTSRWCRSERKYAKVACQEHESVVPVRAQVCQGCISGLSFVPVMDLEGCGSASFWPSIHNETIPIIQIGYMFADAR